MKICIEAQTLNHSKRSGLMTYTEGLVNSLCRHDDKNDYSLIYYSLRRGARQMPGPEREGFRKKVLKFPDRDFAGRQLLLDNIALPLFLKKGKYAIFHRANGYTMPHAGGLFKVLTVHDLRTLTIGDRYWGQNIEKYRRTISAVNVCVVVSECTKRDLVEHLKIEEKKIKVIYLGADERFKPSGKEDVAVVKEKYGIREPFLFSVGSVPRKNIDGIIRGYAASKYVRQYQLVLGCNRDLEQYRSLAKDLGVEKRVLFLDMLKDNDIVALYSSCRAFVFPSLYEGFGLPIVEAMQCGAPVLTSNISSCPEVAGDAALIVDPQKTGEIAEGINRLCGDDSLCRAFVQKGFERAKLFSWDKYAKEMQAVYAMA